VNEPYPLPAGWCWSSLGELLTGIETGKSFKCEERPPTSNEVGVIKVSAVSWGEFQEQESKTCTEAERVNPALFVQRGDFLFSRANTIELVGACVIAQQVTLRTMLSDKILRFRFKTDAMKVWALHLLRSKQGRQQIEALSSGNQDSMRNIGQERIGQIQVPVPPAGEQARIVAKLEELLSDLDAGVSELKAAQVKLQQYRQSLLKAAVEGMLTGDGRYLEQPLGSLLIEVSQGWSPKCESEPATAPDVWAVIKTTAIQAMAFEGSHNKSLPPELSPRPHLEIFPGDLLVTRAGPRSRVGVACLVRESKPKLMLCDKAYRVRCDRALIAPAYLEIVLNSPTYVQKLDAMKSGINDSGLNLTQSRFLALPIPVPSLTTQERIVAVVGEIEGSIQRQALAIEGSFDRSTAQRQNLLRAAFAGQLVPQDPADEPAAALLARIRAQRATAQPVARRSRSKKGTA
jgi:type I restriction enzyme S subunit